jgi:hypothetical protein
MVRQLQVQFSSVAALSGSRIQQWWQPRLSRIEPRSAESALTMHMGGQLRTTCGCWSAVPGRDSGRRQEGHAHRLKLMSAMQSPADREWGAVGLMRAIGPPGFACSSHPQAKTLCQTSHNHPTSITQSPASSSVLSMPGLRAWTGPGARLRRLQVRGSAAAGGEIAPPPLLRCHAASPRGACHVTETTASFRGCALVKWQTCATTCIWPT